ncbi:MAG: hypothetical protein ACI9R3_005970 [Verrucomicrobiales bacterium]|jgi:hypothetical protein
MDLFFVRFIYLRKMPDRSGKSSVGHRKFDSFTDEITICLIFQSKRREYLFWSEKEAEKRRIA